MLQVPFLFISLLFITFNSFSLLYIIPGFILQVPSLVPSYAFSLVFTHIHVHGVHWYCRCIAIVLLDPQAWVTEVVNFGGDPSSWTSPRYYFKGLLYTLTIIIYKNTFCPIWNDWKIGMMQWLTNAGRWLYKGRRHRWKVCWVFSSRRASAQAVTSKWQLRTTSPMNTNSLAGENGFSAKNGSWPGRLWINPKNSNG